MVVGCGIGCDLGNYAVQLCCVNCGVMRDVGGSAMHNVANIWRHLKCGVMGNIL